MKKYLFIPIILSFLIAYVAIADHSWANYHWARTSNPFTLNLSNNTTSDWSEYLLTASDNWSVSSVLNTNIIIGSLKSSKCRAAKGKIEICSKRYGFNGWLGVTTIWTIGEHITKSTVEFNDTYFDLIEYDTPTWRRYLTCHEIGHTFGLAHRDEIFDNTNIGSCLDYTDDPDGIIKGQVTNLQPDQHDYEELEFIYSHLDTFSSIKQSFADQNYIADDWGKEIKRIGNQSVFEKKLNKDEKMITFVNWVK